MLSITSRGIVRTHRTGVKQCQRRVLLVSARKSGAPAAPLLGEPREVPCPPDLVEWRVIVAIFQRAHGRNKWLPMVNAIEPVIAAEQRPLRQPRGLRWTSSTLTVLSTLPSIADALSLLDRRRFLPALRRAGSAPFGRTAARGRLLSVDSLKRETDDCKQLGAAAIRKMDSAKSQHAKSAMHNCVGVTW